MTPFASVAMLEKLALLKMAFCKAPVFSNDASATAGDSPLGEIVPFMVSGRGVTCITTERFLTSQTSSNNMLGTRGNAHVQTGYSTCVPGLIHHKDCRILAAFLMGGKHCAGADSSFAPFVGSPDDLAAGNLKLEYGLYLGLQLLYFLAHKMCRVVVQEYLLAFDRRRI
ncbi:MAG: hypothetical protein WAV95_07825 [Azonexus sp.]